MKANFKYVCYSLMLAFVAFGCGKKDEGNNGGGTPYNTFAAYCQNQPGTVPTSQCGCVPQNGCPAGQGMCNGQCVAQGIPNNGWNNNCQPGSPNYPNCQPNCLPGQPGCPTNCVPGQPGCSTTCLPGQPGCPTNCLPGQPGCNVGGGGVGTGGQANYAYMCTYYYGGQIGYAPTCPNQYGCYDYWGRGLFCI